MKHRVLVNIHWTAGSTTFACITAPFQRLRFSYCMTTRRHPNPVFHIRPRLPQPLWVDLSLAQPLLMEVAVIRIHLSCRFRVGAEPVRLQRLLSAMAWWSPSRLPMPEFTTPARPTFISTFQHQ